MMTNNDGAVVAPKKDSSELKLPSQVDPAIAEQLVDRARTDGVDLVGPDGLLGQLTKQVLEAGLEVEMDEHLGYEKHAHEGRKILVVRQGSKLELFSEPTRPDQSVGPAKRVSCSRANQPAIRPKLVSHCPKVKWR